MKIGIVILSYNNHIDTKECVESLKKIKSIHSTTILVVDNSTDENFYNLNKSIDDIILIRQNVNKGYSSGNNIGIKYFLERDYEYILIINNDTIVENNFLDLLINEYDGNSGLVAPLIYTYPNMSQIWSSGGQFNKVTGRFKMNNNLPSKVEENTFISGCCFLVSKNTVEKAGLLPEDYFMYNEDGEYSYRIKKMGYKLKVVPQSVIYHKESISSGIQSNFQLYYIYRNNFLFIYRNFKGIKKLYYVVVQILLMLVLSISYKKNRKIYLKVIKDRNKTGISY